MPKAAHKVVVIGHRNPDTDSICSAIAYAELKNKTSDLVCEPRRAGKMNQETEFVLKKFGVKPPRMCTDVNPKIRDVDYREMPGIPGSTSLRKAWEIMRDKQIDTLPVTSPDNELEGVITVKDIATANMDVFDTGILAKSQTTYRNILETLGGTMVVGREDDVCTTGHIRIGTATPEMLENTVEKGDIVILTNRYESQLCAIEKEASLLIICNGSKVGRTIQRIAEEMGVAIMSAPVDTYAAGKLISQCAPISYYMTRSDIMKFTLVTPVADVTRVMAKVRHRYFPILDEDGKYCGMVSRRNIINLQKRRIILVDHNEATQAVEGFDQAEILEIIDHHRIGSLETSGPVYFRNQPVGCTATIITQMYDENGMEIPPQIAGLLLAAILSDTLVFRSPTCTPLDEALAKRLAKIAGVDIDEFASEMFEAGEKLDGKTAEEVFLQDFKVFMCGDIRFGVAQGSYMTRKNLKAAQQLLAPLSARSLRQAERGGPLYAADRCAEGRERRHLHRPSCRRDAAQRLREGAGGRRQLGAARRHQPQKAVHPRPDERLSGAVNKHEAPRSPAIPGGCCASIRSSSALYFKRVHYRGVLLYLKLSQIRGKCV